MHIALRYGEVQISILVWFMGFLLLHSLSFCELVGFLGFWGFCCFILYRFKNRWVFGVFGFFAASYFIVLRIGWVFGIFAASYFIILRIGGVFGVFAASYFVVRRVGWVFGVFGVFAASYFVVLRIGGFLGFLGFLLLHTLSF